MTKKYVILTRNFTGLSGNARYVNCKCKYLKEHGWDVVAIWNHNIGEVELEHVKPFVNNVVRELHFYPSWFNRLTRKRVINKMADIIGTADDIVIESNKLQIAAWGEMLAKQLKAKHVVFITTEGITIQSKATFDFCHAKLLRNEFFAINTAMVDKLFSNFLSNIDAERYYWSATNGVEAEEIPFPVFDNLPTADYTISHFGRRKSYFPNMVKGIRSFVDNHKDKKFNVFFLGDIGSANDIKTELKVENVNLAFCQPLEVIPLSFIKKSDLVFATAGCAHIININGGKALSMCVNDHEPLGLLGYTTLDCNVRSGKYQNSYSVTEWLEKTLIEGKTFDRIEQLITSHSFDFQMKFINKQDDIYIDSSKVAEKISAHDRLYNFFMHIGFAKLMVDLFYYKNRKRAVR